MPRQCPQCGAILADVVPMCPQCGAHLSQSRPGAAPPGTTQPAPAAAAATLRREDTTWGDGCPRCGNYVPPGGSFCPACGTRIQRQTGGGAWKVVKVLLAVVLTIVCFAVAALGVVLAACAGMNFNAPPTAEAQAFQVKVLVGLAVLFALWIAGMIGLLR